jgi:hypothetical protein
MRSNAASGAASLPPVLSPPNNRHKNRSFNVIGRPVLILVDEIMDYIRKLSDTEHADLAVRDMAFLRALLDSVNDVPHVAAVVVMIASEKDNMDLDGIGQQRRNELDALLIRNGETATINDNTDFAAILQRRLFERTAPTEVLAATARTFTTLMTGPWRDEVFNAVPATATPEFPDEVARCFGDMRELQPIGYSWLGCILLPSSRWTRSSTRSGRATCSWPSNSAWSSAVSAHRSL